MKQAAQPMIKRLLVANRSEIAVLTDVLGGPQATAERSPGADLSLVDRPVGQVGLKSSWTTAWARSVSLMLWSRAYIRSESNAAAIDNPLRSARTPSPFR